MRKLSAVLVLGLLLVSIGVSLLFLSYPGVRASRPNAYRNATADLRGTVLGYPEHATPDMLRSYLTGKGVSETGSSLQAPKGGELLTVYRSELVRRRDGFRLVDIVCYLLVSWQCEEGTPVAIQDSVLIVRDRISSKQGVLCRWMRDALPLE